MKKKDLVSIHIIEKLSIELLCMKKKDLVSKYIIEEFFIKLCMLCMMKKCYIIVYYA